MFLAKECSELNFVPFLHYVNNEPGSSAAIAGIISKDGLVVGMMPHPERASEGVVGNDCGLIFLLGLARSQNIRIRTASPLAHFAHKLTGEAQ
jgi:phosphoribosylformylglycinamidine synthase